MNRWASVLFWSIIAAAFIGPGTVTTAATAGVRFGPALLWALVFSTVACFVLQEASARLTVVSGRSLGQAIRSQYPSGAGGLLALALVLGAVVLGCAAYEAGNILGGVAGAALVLPLPPELLTVLSVIVAALLLWFNSPRRVAIGLSLLVAIMGVAFLCTAVLLRPALGELVRGALVPSLPEGGALLALGLVGTTVVPYNLFLGSGIAGGQKVSELRFGLAVAIGLGGLISMGVLVVGTAAPGEFGFARIAAVLTDRLGSWAGLVFSLGLFAAGLSSAVTAPLAAAVTSRSLLAGDSNAWSDTSWRYRAVWGGVLAVGLGFGLSGVRPVPVIILAQALNGVVLPLAAIYLLLAVNDRALMGESGLNRTVSNVFMTGVTVVALILGTWGVARAVSVALSLPAPGNGMVLALAAGLALLLGYPVARAIGRRRAG